MFVHDIGGYAGVQHGRARIKRLARTRYLNYQSMMKQWLAERLEQELKNL